MINKLISPAKYFTAFQVIFLLSCQPRSILNKTELTQITEPKSVLNWSLENCNTVISYYTRANFFVTANNQKKPSNSEDNVFVTAVPLLPNVIKAKARKEAMLKRLSADQFFDLLENYFYLYTDYKYERKGDSLIYTNPNPDSAIGLTFHLQFENVTDPYRPIELKDAYEYVFLENTKDEFARVVEIDGRFAETDLYLADFLNVIITFDSKSDDRKMIFDKGLPTEGFRLLFNALQDKPIILEWN